MCSLYRLKWLFWKYPVSKEKLHVCVFSNSWGLRRLLASAVWSDPNCMGGHSLRIMPCSFLMNTSDWLLRMHMDEFIDDQLLEQFVFVSCWYIIMLGKEWKYSLSIIYKRNMVNAFTGTLYAKVRMLSHTYCFEAWLRNRLSYRDGAIITQPAFRVEHNCLITTPKLKLCTENPITIYMYLGYSLAHTCNITHGQPKYNWSKLFS